MADLLAFHTYHTRHSFLSPSTMLSRPTTHRRSISSENRSLSPDRTLTKARSVSDLFGIATDRPGSGNRSSSVGNFADGGFSTLQDPRLINNSSDSSEASSPDNTHHPALSNEVAALSVKLVQAINNQTILDDNLAVARQDLEQARSRVTVLEQENLRYRRDIDMEVLIKKSDVEYDMLRLKAALADEKAQRALIEKEKKGIEQELETLTAALFEEANKMVAAAKLEREAVEKKNEQLRAQIKDTESLLASQQDQLAELKSVLQGVTLNSKDELEVRTTASTAPSSPTASREPSAVANSIEPPMCPQESPPPVEELLPGPCTSFPHLIRTVSRTDLQAFEDFRELFTLSSTASKPASRAPSGSYAGLNVMSLAGFGSSAFGSAASSPAKSQMHSPHGSLSSPQPSGSSIPLKDTRFYKRALVEDIEPTLRLDAAPGISWLTRRSVMSGICDGTLVVEPMPLASKKYEFPCSLCGERRPGTANERTHRFRTSDSETAQRYPLCVLCVERARSSCEFTGYLRLILDGHLRLADVGEEKYAWEETIRLRERMFWSRIGGGIIPIFTAPISYASPPDSLDPLPETDVEDDREISPRDVTGNGREGTPPPTETPDRRDDRSETNDDSDHESIYEDSFISMAPESPIHTETATVQDGKAETQASSPAQADSAEKTVEPVTETPSHREDAHDRPVPDAQR
ncbi:guanine nucleotide exchange factor SEC2 [Aspergillus candidus]|uniref:Sec2p-domain-containing protein n=1 Tax=Aspergillus candidus TaxID=41067 RepID=A0A2I2FF60_ASPCN|nr:Sec2p-domain-containing protein [Aspergillus candidus]PLB39276.1 Sec2p-domain-containing protein [Aspergillus candidus]